MAFDFAHLTHTTTAEAIGGEMLMLLAARGGGALLTHPALVYGGAVNATGSNVVTTPHLGLDGYNIFATFSDGTSIDATDPTFSSTQVTVAKYGLRYSPTDLARLTDATGIINPQRFAQSMFVSATETLVSLIAALGGGFASTVGSSGVDMTVADFLAAIRQLENNNVQGPYLCLLHPQQFSDLLADLSLTSGGAIQYNAAAPDLLSRTGSSYKGTLAGVDIFTSTRVPASGGNRQGMMIGRGAIIWIDGTALLDDPSTQAMYGKVLFERDRNPATGVTEWVAQTYFGVAEGIDLAGVGIITDQ